MNSQGKIESPLEMKERSGKRKMYSTTCSYLAEKERGEKKQRKRTQREERGKLLALMLIYTQFIPRVDLLRLSLRVFFFFLELVGGRNARHSTFRI
jgi:hypothetical protein